MCGFAENGIILESLLTAPQPYPGVERIGSKPVASAPPIIERLTHCQSAGRPFSCAALHPDLAKSQTLACHRLGLEVGQAYNDAAENGRRLRARYGLYSRFSKTQN